MAYRRPERAARLDGLGEWLKERFGRHRGNAEVGRQELVAEYGVEVSLDTPACSVPPRTRLGHRSPASKPSPEDHRGLRARGA